MKYIVYKTTNLVNDFIYIGVHKTDNPDIFDGYIGCGVYINKASTFLKPKTNFQIAVHQYGVKNFKRETLAVFDTEEEAYQLEKLLVNEQFLSRNDVYNMILGGEVTSEMSIKCYKYDMDGNYLEEFNSCKEAALSINKSHSAIMRSIEFKTKCGDFYWNTDKLEKLDLSNYNRVKPICVYRYKNSDGSFDKEYQSLSEAAKDSNATLVQIARSARLGYRVGDFQFLFVKDTSYDKAKTAYIKNRPVFKYSSDGIFIKEYNTQEKAEIENPYSNITRSIKNKKPCSNGFLWALEKLPKYCSTKSKKKKIGKFDLDGNLLETYDSIKECCEKVGIPRGYITIGKIYYNYLYKGI